MSHARDPASSRNHATCVLAMTLLAACAGMAPHNTPEQTAEHYRQYAGEPIESFNYLGRFDRWRALGRDELIVWAALDKAYLLKVAGTCPDLPSATRIGVTSKTGQVSRGFDAVLLPRGQRCTIAEIRPIDTERMKQDERGERAQ